MNNTNYFKDLSESICDCRRIVLLIFLIQNDKNLLHEVCFGERDIISLNIEYKNILMEQHEEYLDYFKNEEESVLEKFLNM